MPEARPGPLWKVIKDFPAGWRVVAVMVLLRLLKGFCAAGCQPTTQQFDKLRYDGGDGR